MRFDEAVGNMLNQNPISPKNPVEHSQLTRDNMYAVLHIDTEQGGDGFLSSVNHSQLAELIGRYNSYNNDSSMGISFYNDVEDYSTAIILNEKGLMNVRKAVQNAVPFKPSKEEIYNLLKKD